MLCICPQESKERGKKVRWHTAGCKKGNVFGLREDWNVKKLGRWENDHKVWKRVVSGGDRRGGEGEDVRNYNVSNVNVERRKDILWLSHYCLLNFETLFQALYCQTCHYGKEDTLVYVQPDSQMKCNAIIQQLFLWLYLLVTRTLQSKKDLGSK